MRLDHFHFHIDVLYRERPKWPKLSSGYTKQQALAAECLLDVPEGSKFLNKKQEIWYF